MTTAAEEKLVEIASLRARCQADMLRHFDDVSRAMPPAQGARYLAGEDGFFIRKKRGAYDPDPSHASRPVIHMDADFDVSGRPVILVDDLIASGDTMIKAAQKMKEATGLNIPGFTYNRF